MVFSGSLASRRSELLAVVSDLDLDVVLRRAVRAAVQHGSGDAALLLVREPTLLPPRQLVEGLGPAEAAQLRAELATTPLPEAVAPAELRSGDPVVRGRLVVEGVTVGELVLLEPAHGRFDEEDLDWLEVLTGVVGVALRNARSYALSELRRDWWELTASVTDSVHPPVVLSAPVNRIVEGAHRLADAEVSAIVRSVDGDGYDVAAELSPHARALPPVLERVRWQVQSAQRSGEPFEVRWGEHGTVAGFPLTPELAFEGVVLVAVPHGEGVLPAHVRELLASFVTHGSLVMDRAILLTERQREMVAADRTRIARDLHDVVVQRLFATGLRLKAAVRGESLGTPVVEEVVADLDTTIRDIRGTIFELEHGRDTSLRAEVAALVREYEPALGFRPTVRTFGALNSLVGRPLAEQVTVVLREALANCARHAGATACVVEISVDEGQVCLVVVDDGRGPGEPSDGGDDSDVVHRSGLRNLQRRATELGGGLSVESATPRGTRLTWWVPTVAQ